MSHLFLEAASWAPRDIGLEAVEAVPAFIEALGDDSSNVQLRAALALAQTTGQDFGEDIEAWQRWWEEQQ
ncbi:MAG: hypothetical protein CEE40_06620 [Chloroflexi bacterium B3_Chlor]|nr:MAG: hypothetical protein CEE40_06620 [Chloroflexi bacterium B3_Chlor]